MRKIQSEKTENKEQKNVTVQNGNKIQSNYVFNLKEVPESAI